MQDRNPDFFFLYNFFKSLINYLCTYDLYGRINHRCIGGFMNQKLAVLRIRIRDPGLGTFLTPRSGIRDGRKSASGSGIRDEQHRSYFLELRNHFFAFLGLKYLNSLMRIWDPGWKKVGSGMFIPDPQH
jgi:hypothetical protein